MKTNARAEKTWNRADNAYQYYSRYISTKEPKYDLSVTDLMYLKNFKGGSATITEPLGTLEAKLRTYADQLHAAAKSGDFEGSLADLDDNAYARVKAKMVAFAELGAQSHETRISGLGVSFTSTLFHFHFPTLVPILDRRALNGARIQGIRVDKQDQVLNLLELYPALIDYFRSRLRSDRTLNLRSLDRLLFVEELRAPFKRSKDR